MLIFFQTSANDWFGLGKTLTVGAAFFVLFALFIWKGIPWIRAQLEAKDLLLQNEIMEARKERDEQRSLRSQEIKAFMLELKHQRQMHTRSFARIASRLEELKKQ